MLVPPFFENFGKRLVKSPKLYFVDSGLACHLLGITAEKILNHSPFLGPLFEGFVASEILKHQIGSGRERQLYWFRDQQGLEVDFVVPHGHRQLLLLETKASRTAQPAMARPLQRLAEASIGYRVRRLVVYRPGKEIAGLAALAPGTQAGSVADLLRALRE
jgi:uncharacterized protein